MNVLVACEESQTVCKAFRERGHRAFSCDLQECSGGHPEWHIQGDVLPLLNGNCTFRTADTHTHTQVGRWDLIIAHPPCTYLTVSGNRAFDTGKYGKKAEKRWKDRVEGAVFFMRFLTADCDKIAVENPIGIMSTVYRKPDQIIQPWQFAITESENTEKSTCLWLKGLANLSPIHTEKPEIEWVEWTDEKTGRRKRQTKWYYETRCLVAKDRAKAASKTFPGIAQAMAEQWGNEKEEQMRIEIR